MAATSKERNRGKAVMYGAGNIGRGFIGELFFRWGFQTVFIDINNKIVKALNQRHEYPVTLLSAENEQTVIVRNCFAIEANHEAAVCGQIASADIMAVSVGVRALSAVMNTLAKAIHQRRLNNAPPLNILICENLLHARDYLRKLILAQLNEEDVKYFNHNIGLIETSIGRMIPAQTPEMQQRDPLQIYAESYYKLPVDKDAFKGAVPDYPYLEAYSTFEFYVLRKMLIHNMGHGAAAYLGYIKEYQYIWEAIGDPSVFQTVKNAMMESAEALCKVYQMDLVALQAYIDDLLERFANRQLGDTIARVGRDQCRKLGENERFFRAARLCEEQGVDNTSILKSIQAALMFQENGRHLTLPQLRQMADIVVMREAMC